MKEGQLDWTHLPSKTRYWREARRDKKTRKKM